MALSLPLKPPSRSLSAFLLEEVFLIPPQNARTATCVIGWPLPFHWLAQARGQWLGVEQYLDK